MSFISKLAPITLLQFYLLITFLKHFIFSLCLHSAEGSHPLALGQCQGTQKSLPSKTTEGFLRTLNYLNFPPKPYLSFAPAGICSSTMMRCSFSSPSSVCTALSSIPQDSMPIIGLGGRLTIATRVLPINSSGS